MMRYFFLSFFIAFLSLNSCAQPKKTYSISNKKAIKSLEEAQQAYTVYELAKAQVILEGLVKEYPDFIEAQIFLAQVHGEKNELEKAIPPLEAAMKIDPTFYPTGWMMLAECYFGLGKYEEAERSISAYMPTPKKDIKTEKRAQLILSSCIYAKGSLNHPVPFEPKNLGPNINSPMDEYYPCITADNGTILYTRHVKTQTNPRGQEDFFISKKVGSEWSPSQPVASINTVQNEGAPSLSADGQTLIFTACEVDGNWGENRTGVGSCDLFYSMKVGEDWNAPKNIGAGINTGAWETQPSYSADGRTLYFIRGKYGPNGGEGQDIWYSFITTEGRWSTPQKVPGKVNTMFEEESVMIHPDGRTLYFTSNGHSGMGGLDIFMSRMLPNGDWDTPINLGYPINTYKNENSLQVTADGQMALMASNREGGEGGLDLYQFELYKQAQPSRVTYVQGVISDKLSFKKLEAHLELIDLTDGKVITETYSNSGNGQFLLCIPAGRDYAMNVSKDGYLFHSENFSLKNYDKYEPYRLDIQLQKLRPGAKIVLNNIFFESSKFDLKPESKIELNKLATLLNANPERKVEIGGHTDNVGADDANLLLSQNRAKAVVDYLVSQGISAERLTSKGYGETVPIASNDTEEGRAKNRRTEFTVTF
jgi:outer membrane protein OmpA-like peptidoglycan-associated protein